MRKGSLCVALVFAAVAAATSSASAAVLYEQYPSGSFTVPTVPSFVWPNNAARDTLGADDFSVPPGQVWTVQSVDAAGAAGLGPGGLDTANVVLYSGGASAPGPAIFSQSGIPLPTACGGGGGGQCDLAPAITGTPKLKPGTYWVSVQTAVVPGEGYEWRWATYPPGESFGTPAVWENPGDFYGTGCTTFRPLLECGLTEAGDGTDLIFALSGDVIDSRFNLGGFESNGKRISLRATFPDAGKAKLKGKKIKKTKKNVGAGAAKLPVKLTAGAKRKLGQGRKVKVSLKVTFTATGGVSYSQKASVKIIPVRTAPGAPPALKLAG